MPDDKQIATLPTAVRGRVWLPGDGDFDSERKPWNLAVDQPAAAVVEAADADDVAALVRFGSAGGLGITTQPCGHGATGRTKGMILLRTGRLDDIEIDVGAQRARIGAGVRSGQLQEAAAAHGLTGLPGSSPVVSVAGVALGGGLSWFGRAFGWVSDAVTAFDVVDAKGQPQHVTAQSDPDLFWALRGGGGEYAIVTGLELALQEAPTVYGGRMLWSASHTPAVVNAFRTITQDAPNEFTAWLELLQFPGADPMVAIDTTFLGDEASARQIAAELDTLPAPLTDGRRTMSVAELGSITAEPTTPSPGVSRGELLTALDDDAVAALLAEPIAPVTVVQIRHLGGALAQGSDSPHGPLTEPYAAYLYGIAPDAATAEVIAAKQADIVAALPISGRKPVTFLNPTETLADALPPASIERLRRIKADRDPAGIFRGNFSVAG